MSVPSFALPPFARSVALSHHAPIVPPRSSPDTITALLDQCNMHVATSTSASASASSSTIVTCPPSADGKSLSAWSRVCSSLAARTASEGTGAAAAVLLLLREGSVDGTTGTSTDSTTYRLLTIGVDMRRSCAPCPFAHAAFVAIQHAVELLDFASATRPTQQSVVQQLGRQRDVVAVVSSTVAGCPMCTALLSSLNIRVHGDKGSVLDSSSSSSSSTKSTGKKTAPASSSSSASTSTSTASTSSSKNPPSWVPDAAAASCMRCSSSFTLTRRRHHCRACGKVFCGTCSDQRLPLSSQGGKDSRVCRDCFKAKTAPPPKKAVDPAKARSPAKASSQRRPSPGASSAAATNTTTTISSSSAAVSGTIRRKAKLDKSRAAVSFSSKVWYYENASRSDAEAILTRHGNVGDFVVRRSSTGATDASGTLHFALSYVGDSGRLSHTLFAVTRSADGGEVISLKVSGGQTRKYPSIEDAALDLELQPLTFGRDDEEEGVMADMPGLQAKQKIVYSALPNDSAV